MEQPTACRQSATRSTSLPRWPPARAAGAELCLQGPQHSMRSCMPTSATAASQPGVLQAPGSLQLAGHTACQRAANEATVVRAGTLGTALGTTQGRTSPCP